jgi:hypothetical protein
LFFINQYFFKGVINKCFYLFYPNDKYHILIFINALILHQRIKDYFISLNSKKILELNL